MDKEFNPIPTTKSSNRVFLDAHNDNEVWLSIQVANGSAHVTLTRDQAQLMLEQLTQIVDSITE